MESLKLFAFNPKRIYLWKYLGIFCCKRLCLHKRVLFMEPVEFWVKTLVLLSSGIGWVIFLNLYCSLVGTTKILRIKLHAFLNFATCHPRLKSQEFFAWDGSQCSVLLFAYFLDKMSSSWQEQNWSNSRNP